MYLRQHIEAQDLLWQYMVCCQEVECIDVTDEDEPVQTDYETMYNAEQAEVVGFKLVDSITRKRNVKEGKRLLIVEYKRPPLICHSRKPRRKIKRIQFLYDGNLMGYEYPNWEKFFAKEVPCANPHLMNRLRWYVQEEGGKLPVYVVQYNDDTFEMQSYPEFCHTPEFLSNDWTWITQHIYYKDKDELMPILAKERDALVEGVNVNDVTLFDVFGVKKGIARSQKSVLVTPEEPDAEPDLEEFDVADDLKSALELGLSAKPQPYYEFPRRDVDLRDYKLIDVKWCLRRGQDIRYFRDYSPTILTRGDLDNLKDAYLFGDPDFWYIGVYDEELDLNNIDLPDYDYVRPDNGIDVI